MHTCKKKNNNKQALSLQNGTYRGALKPAVGNHQKTSDAQESTPMKIQEEEILN